MTLTPIASLPMYDWPDMQPAVNRLWAEIATRCRAAGLAAPDSLDRRADYASPWIDPGLVLSQTCGYPYVKSLRGRAVLVGAPVYEAPGCAGPTYRSMMIVRDEDPVEAVPMLRGRRAAINDHASQSGYSALRAIIAPYAGGGRFFGAVIESGGHRASMRAVAEGRADVAAIDCVSWALAGRHEQSTVARLRVLTQSPVAPSLPYITSATAVARDRSWPARLREIVRQSIGTDPAYFRKELLLVDVESIEDAAYDRIIEIESEAIALGYPEVA